MKAKWIEEQVALIGSGKGYFTDVPTDIGKICYCDTSSLKEAPDSPQKKKTKVLIISLIAIVILLAIWIIGSHIGYQTLGSVLVLVFAIIFISAIFGDVGDYYIGDLGFSIVTWNSNKTKIKTRQTYYFNDIDLCFLGEQDKIQDGDFGKSEYDGTEYTLSIYKKNDENYVKTYSYSGRYKRESKDDPDDLWMFADYNFIKKVYQMVCAKHLEQKDYEFMVLKDSIKNTKLGYGVLKNVTAAGHTMKTIDNKSIEKITLDGNNLIIGDKRYDLNYCKVYIHQGWLLIGRDEGKDTIYIEISAISHNKAFLALLADSLIVIENEKS